MADFEFQDGDVVLSARVFGGRVSIDTSDLSGVALSAGALDALLVWLKEAKSILGQENVNS
jgi:hypothetical protein